MNIFVPFFRGNRFEGSHAQVYFKNVHFINVCSDPQNSGCFSKTIFECSYIILFIYIYIYIYIYILHTSKPIYITIRLLIFLSTDNVLTLLQYGTGGGQSVELPGRAENLRNCSCCCHGSVLWGVYHKCSSV